MPAWREPWSSKASSHELGVSSSSLWRIVSDLDLCV
jgi:hypothetical protein